jgi:hypothetical protein
LRECESEKVNPEEIRVARRTLPALVAAVLALALSVAPASAATRRPIFKSFSYTPIGNVPTEENPQARFSATVRLYAHAPSVEFAFYGNGGNIDTGVLGPKSYGPGLHRISIKGDALPAGTFKITLVVNLPGGRHLDGSKPVTLVVTPAGPGTVTKL